jgi:biopolymer transport protein ExbD
MAHARHRHGYSEDDNQAIAAINTTPLVDVMLVLLIIFLITIPVALKTVPVSLPKERNIPSQSNPKNINIAVDAGGSTYWNNLPILNQEDLLNRLREIARQDPQPEVHIRGDAKTRYEPIGRVVLAIQRAGIVKVSFITEPPAKQ